MGAMFTQHAVERMGERDIAPADRTHLLALVERIGKNPAELAHSDDVVRIGRPSSGQAFIVRSGGLRAIVALDPTDPERVIVMNVYRADVEEPLTSPVD